MLQRRASKVGRYMRGGYRIRASAALVSRFGQQLPEGTWSAGAARVASWISHFSLILSSSAFSCAIRRLVEAELRSALVAVKSMGVWAAPFAPASVILAVRWHVGAHHRKTEAYKESAEAWTASHNMYRKRRGQWSNNNSSTRVSGAVVSTVCCLSPNRALVNFFHELWAVDSPVDVGESSVQRSSFRPAPFR